MAWENLTISGMPNGLTFDSFPASITGNSQVCVSYSGTPLELGTFEVNVTGEMILDFFGSPYSIGNVSSSLNIVVESNPNPIPGCTYEHAVNHSPIASVDDGSCIFKGCTDPCSSPIMTPYASVDDGTCESEPCDDGEAVNMGDLNNDGAVGSSDLLRVSLGLRRVLSSTRPFCHVQPLHCHRRRSLSNSDRGSICQVGWVLFENGHIVSEFSSLVNPNAAFLPRRHSGARHPTGPGDSGAVIFGDLS